ncbi:MAG: hypothetical protein NC921_00370 [Candidatus Omnitrophica bacterium]|nr:hypothetical protein [Candidatus Omnitrophota bacterium]MCM8808777.1 hypothetical protein [Candidatus Omnitrophota bacterium]MCM8811055.1 hypothetical protein [Candidatus Omnitrophota bacterium]
MGKFLKTFFTLFVAMNVIGILPIFLFLTENLHTKEEKQKLRIYSLQI